MIRLLKKEILFLVTLLIGFAAIGQPDFEKDILLGRLAYTEVVPADLLATRSVVLFDEGITQKDLEEAQTAFQQTGIDAEAYFNCDDVLAGVDPEKAFSTLLNVRQISYLIFFSKEKSEYSVTFVPYNGKGDLISVSAPAWKQKGPVLREVLLNIYRLAVSNQKKKNFLINDLPETDIPLKYFTGRRNETYTAMVKSFRVAVPKFGNDRADTALVQMLKQYFPVKYELVDPELDDRELERRGFITVLRFVHTRGRVAKKILDYDLTQMASSIASVMMVNGEAQIKTIPAEESVYKFYIKHLEYGNIFLGNKWDADQSWQIALANHLQLMRLDLKY
jgi:hypothetical protein